VKLFFEIVRISGYIALLLFANMACAGQTTPVSGPDVDLTIHYYDRVMTSEGVLRESNYEETMLRRNSHVWTARVLPKTTESHRGHDAEHEHKHFNAVVLPRHLWLEGASLKLAYVDRSNKEIINIAATEYENVNFDGSWVNASFIVDPKLVALMPLSKKVSAVAGARWHEQEKNGIFQRVLWDDKNMIPLEVETGKRDGTIFRRVSVKLESVSGTDKPWSNLKGYTQKEYSDFLD
jgi:hypothetical protein